MELDKPEVGEGIWLYERDSHRPGQPAKEPSLVPVLKVGRLRLEVAHPYGWTDKPIVLHMQFGREIGDWPQWMYKTKAKRIRDDRWSAAWRTLAAAGLSKSTNRTLPITLDQLEAIAAILKEDS